MIIYLIFLYQAIKERKKYKTLIKEMQNKQYEKEQNIVVFDMENFSQTINMSNKEIDDLKNYIEIYNPFYEKKITSNNAIGYQHINVKSNRITIYNYSKIQ